MQSKGFIRVLAVALVLVCAFYLSFSFVTRHYEGIAKEYAQAKANTDDTSDDTYKSYYKQYIDSLAKEKVYLGYYTFQQAREMEVGLGLDLKGGMNVTLQISVPDILRALSQQNPDPKFNEALQITEKQQENSAEKDFVSAFCREYTKLAPEGSLYQIFRGGVERLTPGANNAEVEKVLKEEVDAMVDNTYNVLRTRIDRFGVVSPNIQKLESTGRILLELPGVKEPERVMKLLKGTANLEFYETYTINELEGALVALNTAIVAPSVADSTVNDSTVKAEAPKALLEMLQAGRGGASIAFVSVRDTAAVNAILNSPEAARILPNDLKARWSVKSIDERGQYYELVALKTVQGKPVLTGEYVTDASSEFDNMQGQVVSMTMNDEGARKWATVTRQNLNKAIAIVLDDQVYSFPNVNSEITGGRSQITGDFSVEEANDLANVLKSGKMVARVNDEGMSVIGPSLGQEAIESGLISFVVALVLLMIFMVVVYGWAPGLVANLGLVLNLFFTLGILASIQAVLTLPGIAGIVLSMGMAVDANVLIFERAKEELRAGKGLKAAVADGYSNAFSAIFDSNLTSVITALILLLTGSGPIKGFATTLIIGIICSFFTAVFVTRLVMEYLVARKNAKITFNTSLSKNWMQNVKFDFIGSRSKVWMVVAVLVVAVGVLLGVRRLSPGIDFSGGRNYTVQFDHAVSTENLKAQLAPLFPEANLSVITIDNDTKVRISTNYKIESTEDGVDDEIMQKLYEGLSSELNGMSYNDFSLANEDMGVSSTEKVGPSIASDMTREACWAVFFSLIAMGLYILIRFRNIAFSVGALCAVAFTTFLVSGFYGLYGMFPFSMEVDQNFIAAILTIIGYQVNDTVVVFDRVRETRTLYPKQDSMVTFNHALNSTLARTTMTSLSTLLVLIVIFVLGGETIRSFVFAMSLGVIFGTLASLFIASPVAYMIVNRSAKKA